MDLLSHIRDKMTNERIMFVYRGVITKENTIPLLMLLEKEMENSEFGFLGRKRLFMFVLESLQNVSKHSDKNNLADMSLVVYSKINGGYTVTTGNVISTSNVDSLRNRLDEINNLQPEDIRDVYRKMLSSSELSSKGGAGLGLIEMAKSTGNKLDYDFLKMDDENSYYILSKTVDSKGTGIHFGDRGKPFTGMTASQIERIMAENNIYFIWSGHVTPDVGKEMLSFTETRLTEAEIESSTRKKVFSILVEIIENVAKHSAGRDTEKKYGMPVAMIRLENSTYIILTGNLISNNAIENLKEKLDIINVTDKSGLKELFRNSLFHQTEGTESTGNMGLIDMARKSGNKLTYKFEKINDMYSYYILEVRVEERGV
ncbi:MAG: SiaB family protein kinase [Bacteroidales bacterium]|nr:SiaB family protein kinase [Bacteroidales bacterium]